MSFIYGSCNIETISPTLLKKTREYLGEKSVVYMNKPIESVEVSGDRKYFFYWKSIGFKERKDIDPFTISKFVLEIRGVNHELKGCRT